MELWIPITLAAALFQAWRTALQQRLRAVLSINAAGFVRYFYALPVGAVLVAGFYGGGGVPLPSVTGRFLGMCALGGALQIVGTNLLIAAFGFRGFAVGTAYAKTEAAQTALLAWLLLGERLPAVAVAGILVGVAGVLVLSLAGRQLRLRTILRDTFQPAALCGLGTGATFALTGICIKEANRALGGGLPLDLVRQASFVLLVTNLMQSLMQGAWLAWREPDQLRAALRLWRRAAWVGALSACGSACWFSGFALAPVALVRALGQVEVVFMLLFSRFYLRETLRRAEVIGLAAVMGGVGLILWGR